MSRVTILAVLSLLLVAAPEAPAAAQAGAQGDHGARLWQANHDRWGYRSYRYDPRWSRSYGAPWGYYQPRWQPPQQRRAPSVASGGAKPKIAPLAPEKVAFANEEPVGSIVIDTDARTLYYVLSETEAYAYPISVGREGFEWTGTETITRVANWPEWRPPAEMRRRQPNLPIRMTGGVKNPLGAKALYLGDTLYRIHGTNEVKSIGQAASSGCFRMRNEHVVHLAGLIEIGAQVTVVKNWPPSDVVRASQSGERARAQAEDRPVGH